MKDKLEIRRLRRELKRVLVDEDKYRNRVEKAISFIEKYSIMFKDTPTKIGLNIEETNELLKLLKGECDERTI